MITFDEAGDMLDEISAELPEEFFRELNGGICLLPDTKLHPESKECDSLYILGEYCRQAGMGRFINIYYGSFVEMFRHTGAANQRAELKKTLLHELTHHMESLAGEYGLEIKDAESMERYKRHTERRK